MSHVLFSWILCLLCILKHATKADKEVFIPTKLVG